MKSLKMHLENAWKLLKLDCISAIRMNFPPTLFMWPTWYLLHISTVCITWQNDGWIMNIPMRQFWIIFEAFHFNTFLRYVWFLLGQILIWLSGPGQVFLLTSKTLLFLFFKILRSYLFTYKNLSFKLNSVENNRYV